MIEAIIGNETGERVLLYLQNYEEGYGAKIATTFELPISQVQKQLERFEVGGILVSVMQGRTRVYKWNPRYPLLKPLKELLSEAFKFLPKEDIKKYYRQRTRPRRKGKPI